MLIRLLLILAAFMLGAVSPSAADTYEVTGIAPYDVLNIRLAPRASAPKVGYYGPRAKGIRIYRRVGNWALTGRSRRGQPDGWVNARYLRPTAETSGIELPLSCVGTEPFWSLTIDSPWRATYSDPETEALRYRVSEFESFRGNARMRLDRNGRVRIATERCSDGMSDRRYPYSVRVLLPEGDELEGCCR